MFWRGIIPWFGFRSHCLDYEPEARHSGASKYNLRAMARLSAAGVFATSLRPLRFSITLGLAFAGLALLYAIYAIVARFGFAHVVPGWTSIIGSIMLVGGIQLIMLGIIGHYLGQVLVQSRGRPVYIVREADLGQAGGDHDNCCHPAAQCRQAGVHRGGLPALECAPAVRPVVGAGPPPGRRS